MKRNDISALHDLTVDELTKLLDEKRQAYQKASLEKRAGKYRGRRVNLLADDVARVATVLGEKQLQLWAERNLPDQSDAEQPSERKKS